MSNARWLLVAVTLIAGTVWAPVRAGSVPSPETHRDGGVLQPGVDARQVRRAFFGGNDRAIGQVVGGPPVSLQSLISPGTTNDNAVRFARKGRYAFVCFFGEHNRLGMYKVFRVR